jgi:hypothetical protein
MRRKMRGIATRADVASSPSSNTPKALSSANNAKITACTMAGRGSSLIGRAGNPRLMLDLDRKTKV